MCGNGIRCVAKYCYDNAIVNKKEMEIETLSGIKHIKINTQNGVAKTVCVDMGKAEFAPSKIPAKFDGEKVVAKKCKIGDTEYEITCVSMGNPHCVVFVPHVENIDLESVGPKFEESPLFPEGVNVEFVKVIDKHTLKMRVWERGSGETWACGTGACAVAVAATLNGYCEKGKDVTVKLLGGDLKIKYTDGGVFMSGDAVKVFDGEVEV
ncbi:MAG: diaminopimelate epimerase, partial [Clostridia bacterium]|nr:diaminopimelate epimerase [Clostridia bacterium]